jgi:hypothetical protein
MGIILYVQYVKNQQTWTRDLTYVAVIFDKRSANKLSRLFATIVHLLKLDVNDTKHFQLYTMNVNLH